MAETRTQEEHWKPVTGLSSSGVGPDGTKSGSLSSSLDSSSLEHEETLCSRPT